MRRKDKVIGAGPSVVAAVTLTVPLPQHGDSLDSHNQWDQCHVNLTYKGCGYTGLVFIDL